MPSKEHSLSDVLEKMVDHLVNHDEIAFLDLVQYVWRKGWCLGEVPDPADAEPLRYALKACLLERMAEIWSAPPKNIFSVPPEWCKTVPAVKHPFSVIAPEFRKFWQGERGSAIFLKRNIFAPDEFMFFL